MEDKDVRELIDEFREFIAAFQALCGSMIEEEAISDDTFARVLNRISYDGCGARAMKAVAKAEKLLNS